jgi:Fe-S-cluster containining protein
MESYFAERSILFNASSEFSCPDGCERYGCKEPGLHISISLVDLLAISSTSNQKASGLIKKDCKIGFDPIEEGEPWLGRISIELKKPCSFLYGKECSVYRGRPIACALFPEYSFMVGSQKDLLKREIFRNLPCIQNSCSIPSRRRETLQKLMEMSIQETFPSDFYLFGISPFVLDLKTMAGAGLDGICISEDGKAELPHHRIEGLIFQKLEEGGYLKEWEAKVEQLDRTDGLKRLTEMKGWTDQMAMTTHRITPRIAYQFDGNRFLPIHLCK